MKQKDNCISMSTFLECFKEPVFSTTNDANVTFLNEYLCSPVNVEPVSRDKYETGKTSDGLGKSEFRLT